MLKPIISNIIIADNDATRLTSFFYFVLSVSAKVRFKVKKTKLLLGSRSGWISKDKRQEEKKIITEEGNEKRALNVRCAPIVQKVLIRGYVTRVRDTV